jgi:hypothetical protein
MPKTKTKRELEEDNAFLLATLRIIQAKAIRATLHNMPGAIGQISSLATIAIQRSAGDPAWRYLRLPADPGDPQQ